MRRVATTLLLSLSMLWFALLPAVATEGEEAAETSQIEGGGDDAFLYLFVFGIVWGIVVFFDASSSVPADEDSHHDGATH